MQNVAFVCNICTSCYWFLIRSRLSYEQFGAFLGNVKDLNAHKQTKDVRRILSPSLSRSFFFAFLQIWNLDLESIRIVLFCRKRLGKLKRYSEVTTETSMSYSRAWSLATLTESLHSYVYTLKLYTRNYSDSISLFSWLSSKTKWTYNLIASPVHVVYLYLSHIFNKLHFVKL